MAPTKDTDPLPLYACHKQVRAAKIVGLDPEPHGPSVALVFDGHDAVLVDREWVARHKPQTGGYFVVYADGYQSFSPAKAFEDGYTRVTLTAPDEIEDISRIARVCHEVNRAYCASLGDTSQPAWEDAPEWQRSSARAGVEAIVRNPETTPEQSHEGWLAIKAADGWKYGPVKNPETEEHPCFVPYADLPPEQRVKDHIFGAVVRALLADAEEAP